MHYIVGLIILYFIVKYSLKYSKRLLGALRAAAQKRTSEKVSSQRYAQLEALGYFKHANRVSLQKNKPALLAWLTPANKALCDPSVDNKQWTTSRRGYSADGEELAEGHIEDIIEDIDILKAMGIAPKITTHYPKDWSAHSKQQYQIRVNDKTYSAWEKKHVDEGTLWGTATACFAAIVDDLLIDNGHDERVYVLYAGANEAIALLLTPMQYGLLQLFGKESASTEREISEQLGFNPRA